MHVVFSEHDDGRVELWYRTGTGAFPALPQARAGTASRRCPGPTAPACTTSRCTPSSASTPAAPAMRRRTACTSTAIAAAAPWRRCWRNSRMPVPRRPLRTRRLRRHPLPGLLDPEPPGRSRGASDLGGTPVPDYALTASTGTWSGEPAAYTYQWQWSRDRRSTWRDVTGANEQPDLDITRAFIGAEVRVVVTAANASGSESAASASVSAVATALVAPSALVPPLLSGTPVEGEALTASSGVWAGSRPRSPTAGSGAGTKATPGSTSPAPPRRGSTSRPRSSAGCCESS